MRILFLTQIVPYPPDAGPKIKTWNVLRFLAQRGHEIVLVTFCRPQEREFLAAVREVCQEVHPIRIRRSRLGDVFYWARSMVSGRPFLIERDDDRGMRRVVDALLAAGRFDVVHADQLTMTQFVSHLALNGRGHGAGGHEALARRPRLIFDAHNAVWTILKRMRASAPLWLRPIVAMEQKRVERYEGRVVATFDYTLAVSEADRKALAQAALGHGAQGGARGGVIGVVPIAIDARRQDPPRPLPNTREIVTIGTLHYPPNADGIRWFLKDVFPLVQARVPEATLSIIGKNPPDDLRELAGGFGGRVIVTGYLPDLEPWMAKAALMVVPVRAGGGMRVRILEGFARGMPMVTTTLGLEGIQARPGEDVLVADTEADFAEAVVRLLADPGLRQRLSASGRQVAVSRYDWEVVLRCLEDAYTLEGAA
jgi:polysaccharide biosynthesis protein PslH